MKLIENPDFEEWADDIPDGWYRLKEDDKYKIECVILKRIYYFNILGIRFIIKGRNLLKIRKRKEYIIKWTTLNK